MSQKPKYCKNFERNSHWRKLSMVMVWERYCYASPKPNYFFIFFVYIFIHISANMSPFGLKFSQMILQTETSKLMYNWFFLFVVLHKPTLLPSIFKVCRAGKCHNKIFIPCTCMLHVLTPPPPPPSWRTSWCHQFDIAVGVSTTQK